VAEKVVFDTNIRLAAVLWRGAAYNTNAGWRRGQGWSSWSIAGK
jgi:predicted nucleic acid-binding protein